MSNERAWWKRQVVVERRPAWVTEAASSVSAEPIETPRENDASVRELEERCLRLEQELASTRERSAESAAAANAEISMVRDDARIARAELAAQAARAKERLGELAREFEGKVLELALAVARKVVENEIRTDPQMIVDWVRDVVAEGSIDAHSIAVSPQVASEVPEAAWSGIAPVVRIDPSLKAGRCEVRGENSVVEVGADARFDAVASHLGAERTPEAA